MLIRVNPQNGIAIYDQVVRQVKFAVAGGGLRTGELVPSVRELARRLAINPNTVARAYRQLQDEGVLQSLRGTGLQVTTAAESQCQRERTELIAQRLREVLEEAEQAGLDTNELLRLTKHEIQGLQERKGDVG